MLGHFYAIYYVLFLKRIIACHFFTLTLSLLVLFRNTLSWGLSYAKVSFLHDGNHLITIRSETTR